MDPAPAVVFVTDYGIEDTYGTSLLGAAWQVDPSLRCVAGTHGVPPGDVLAGAYHVKAVSKAFAAGTVICAVVDPDVGTARSCIAVSAAGILCVAPDNGLVSYLWAESDPGDRRAVELRVPAAAAATFTGRDLLAGVAARLAGGATLDECGNALSNPMVLPEAFAGSADGALLGRSVVIDHFGNAITTIRLGDLAGRRPVRAVWPGGRTAELVRTYAEITGALGLLVGSAGHLEVAARRGRAVDAGGPGWHDPVRVELG